jgi:hypothetical protein
MPLPILIAMWCFMRAHPTADFDAFADAGRRGPTRAGATGAFYHSFP